MRGSGHFEYWPELLLVVLMLSVLIVNFIVFEN